MVRNRLAGVAVSALCILAASCASNSASAPKGLDVLSRARITQGFDADWRFTLGDAAGANQAAFDDSAWRQLDVPHDWSIEGAIDEHNPSGKSEAFLPTGVGWYRKHFTLPQNLSGRAIFIDFDGVLANSDVWINNVHLGHRPYGYVSFSYELTGHLNFGSQENVLAVRCDNSRQPASRWYSGSGIYRHVRLVVEKAVHLARYSPYITTPTISDTQATVHVQTTVINQSRSPRRVLVGTIILDPAGKPIAADPTDVREIPPGASADFEQDIYVHNPQRWDIDQPNLYRAVTQVMDGDLLADDTSTSFGIREFHFSADTGFWLNGRNFKLYGCALHADGGAVGAAVPLGVWERRLALLKAVGCNAIRTAHNPPAPEFLDLCDRMGFLVMDEMFDVWTVGKTPLRSRTVLADYHLYFRDWWQRDVTDTVERDRNHPSIVLWSAGNEIHDISPNSDLGFRLFVPLRDLYHKLDPTRPVTLAVVRPNGSHVYDNGFADLMDVVGQNYRENELEAAHAAKPTRKILGTENRGDVATWLHLRDNPALSGQFIWTGVDYMGESPRWPIISSSAGLFDRTLLPKATAYQRASWWTSKPVVYIARILPPIALPPAPALQPGMDAGAPPQPRRLSDWTVREPVGHVENLEIYTNCQRVELFLNGQSLGVQNRHADDSPLTWKVPYQPGELTAVARNEGEVVASQTLQTAGPAAKIELTADQATLPATWDSVSFVRATVVDANGVTVPDASNLITFQISGPGRIAAVDNGDPMSHEAFVAMQRSAFRGHCLAIVKATGAGPITITASGANLPATSMEITGTGQ
jgi:beta-galactosidase